MVEILDCTIRDGSYVTGYNWEKQDLIDIVTVLSNSQIKFIEIGNGTGLGAYRNIVGALDDESYIKTCVSHKGNSKIGAFFIPKIGNKEDILKFCDLGGDFIRIGVNPNSEDLKNALEYIEFAKSKDLYVCVNLMKTYALSKYQFAEKCSVLQNYGIDCIYVVDSAGTMLPNQVAEYIRIIKDLYNIELGFHGHNNLMLANANSLSAAENGAILVDSSLMSLGRGAGNAQTESLVAILQKANLLNKDIDIISLSDVGSSVISKYLKRNQTLLKQDIMIGLAMFHDSNMNLVEKYAKEYNIDSILLMKEVSKINIINPSEELFKKVAERISNGDSINIFYPKFPHKDY